MRNKILYYSLKYHGEWQQITNAIGKREPTEPIDYPHPYVTVLDENYPTAFRKLRYVPWVIFYEGDLSLLEKKAVSLIGARECNTYGKEMAIHVTRLLKERAVIVSGLAKGIDAIVHQEALDYHTIGVIGCGIDRVYPRENALLYDQMRKDHLIVSEYPCGSKPLAYHFPWRNRLIAALGSALVVIQAKKRSGTLLTVNEALELGIPVYCIPHKFNDMSGFGSNILLSQGANILTDDQDILAIL
ncbi:DNA-protecting protein DprA [bacterium c-19]|nr:DNA-protecting protein DprA [bacterium c-19]